tara:strand:+ start:365 stop:529 length:165 start_codon:yes stop_codon:yes gene_type:complete
MVKDETIHIPVIVDVGKVTAPRLLTVGETYSGAFVGIVVGTVIPEQAIDSTTIS